MRVRVQTGPDWRAKIKPVKSQKLEGPGGHWRCPTCGGLQFTVKEEAPGLLVLACFNEPTYIGIGPSFNANV